MEGIVEPAVIERSWKMASKGKASVSPKKAAVRKKAIPKIKRAAEKILALLDEREMIPADLSRATGIHEGRISKWLDNDGTPTIPQFHKIARALDVDMGYLVNDHQDAPAVLSAELQFLIDAVDTLGIAEAKRRLMQAPPVIQESVNPGVTGRTGPTKGTVAKQPTDTFSGNTPKPPTSRKGGSGA